MEPDSSPALGASARWVHGWPSKCPSGKGMLSPWLERGAYRRFPERIPILAFGVAAFLLEPLRKETRLLPSWEREEKRKEGSHCFCSLSQSEPTHDTQALSECDGWMESWTTRHLLFFPSEDPPFTSHSSGSRVNPCPQLPGPVPVTREVSSLLYPPWGGSLYRHGHQTGCLSKPQDYREVG